MATEDKELFFKINLLEQYMKNVQQQIEAVENEIAELASLKEGIEGLKESSGKETFSSLGKNIFIKTKIVSGDLLVGIGDKTLVKKSVPETSRMISVQLKKLETIKGELIFEMEKLNTEAEKLLASVESN